VATTRLAHDHDLRIVDVEELSTHGGSLRIYLAHAASKHATSQRVTALLEREVANGFRTPEGYSGYAEKVQRT
jgi:hypothetical protein